MRPLSIAVLWLFCTLASAASTPTVVLAGPWMVLRPDGALEVAVEVDRAPEPGLPELFVLRDADDAAIAVAATGLRDLDRPWRGRSTVVTYRLAADEVARLAGREIGLHRGDRLLTRLRTPRRPRPGKPAVLAVAPGARYPSGEELLRLSDALGAPVQAVVVVGTGVARSLGTGDWEHELPILPVGVADDPVLIGMFGAGGVWQHGLAWGELGLPVVTRLQDAALAVARDLHPLQVVIEPDASWRADLRDAGRRGDLPLLLAAARRHRIPLILGCGTGAGFLSEPLSVGRGTELLAVAGGTRYCAVASGTDSLRHVGDRVATALDGGAVVGLWAHETHLRLAVDAASGGQRFRLDWELWPRFDLPLSHTDTATARRHLQRWIKAGRGSERLGRAVSWLRLDHLARLRDEGIHARTLLEAAGALGLTEVERERFILGPYPWPEDDFGTLPEALGYPWPPRGLDNAAGWGVGNADLLFARWHGDDDEVARQAAHLLAWLPAHRLARLLRDPDDLRAACDRALERGERHLLRRLAAVNLLVSLPWMDASEAVPTPVVRAAMLRYLAGDSPTRFAEFTHLAARADDPHLVRALVYHAESRTDLALLHVLMRRLRLQAEGHLAVDADPLLQHQMVDAVFSSPYLSPTPLRPIARSLVDRLHPLARQTIDRFFARHGRFRPVDR